MASQVDFSICPLASESTDFSDDFDCSKEGLKYIAGFIAKKFRIKYPHLGTKTIDKADVEDFDSKWIIALSRGGLTLPSKEFLSKICLFEKIFKEIHGNGLNTQHGVIETTIQYILKRFPEFPRDIIKKFVRTRTFIRIKELNCRIKNSTNKKRSANKFKHFTS
jgi:hypothetical protein